MDKKTALYDCHLKAGGKMVSFAGYVLPVQYETGVITEHMAVRQAAGLFDVSHMGEVMYEGIDALKNINHILTNDFTSMKDNDARYGIMCYETGGVIDDLIVYKYNANKYMIVVNASNREKDVKWMKEQLFGEVSFADISDELSQIAIQGPKAKDIMLKLIPEDVLPKKNYSFTPKADIAGIKAILSWTGYTGEDGYEIYIKNADAPFMWETLLKAGEEFGLIPCGLGARDTLRLEAAMPLYGHEMDDSINPLEAGLNFAVKLNKDEFIGRDALIAAKDVKRKRVGLKVAGRGIVREHEMVYADGKEIGHTTSGTHCPYLKGAYAMAILDIDYTGLGTKVMVMVRGREIPAEVIPLPFYKKA